jgi:hypothetical protein
MIERSYSVGKRPISLGDFLDSDESEKILRIVMSEHPLITTGKPDDEWITGREAVSILKNIFNKYSEFKAVDPRFEKLLNAFCDRRIEEYEND